MNYQSKPRVTSFQRCVYEIAKEIPRGRVTTYKILAVRLKCRSCRAVGQALRRNPFAPEVPCHRIIASDLTPGGFLGKKTGAPIRRKLKLLRTEGVKFKKGRLADPAVIYRFDLKKASG